MCSKCDSSSPPQPLVSEHSDAQPLVQAPAEEPPPRSYAARAGVALVRFYQRYLSPLKPPVCRFFPSCSHYTLVAIQRYGFLRGSWMGFWRIMRCHPFHPGGYDPVP